MLLMIEVYIAKFLIACLCTLGIILGAALIYTVIQLIRSNGFKDF